jgi:hypothetical protein
MGMAESSEKTIDDLFEEGTPIDEALRKAVRDALLRHKKLGNPIAVWEDSRVVWIPPEEIELDDGHPEGASGPTAS